MLDKVESRVGPEALEEQTENTSPSTPESDDVPYSVLTTCQKRWISVTTSLTTMFFNLSSYIYYPALFPLSKDLGVSIFLINLRSTSYRILAGIAPAFMGHMADNSGRRPVYILMFFLMIGANTGIAVQSSHPALLILPMVQSAGALGRSRLS